MNNKGKRESVIGGFIGVFVFFCAVVVTSYFTIPKTVNYIDSLMNYEEIQGERFSVTQNGDNYYGVYEYFVDDERYTARGSKQESSTESTPEYITVRYNPADPSEYNTESIWILLLLWFFILMMSIGVVKVLQHTISILKGSYVVVGNTTFTGSDEFLDKVVPKEKYVERIAYFGDDKDSSKMLNDATRKIKLYYVTIVGGAMIVVMDILVFFNRHLIKSNNVYIGLVVINLGVFIIWFLSYKRYK